MEPKNIDLRCRDGQPVRGTLVDSRFEPLLAAFVDCFESRGETSASLCIAVRGVPVVNVWGGHSREDSLYILRSASKGVLSSLVHAQARAGALRLDDPVCRYWPQFGQNGKASITVAQVLSHTAGLAVLDTLVPLERLADRAFIAAAIERQSPQWEPGGTPGYHDHSYGWILGELLFRITGLDLDGLLGATLRKPHGLVLHYGLPAALRERVAQLRPPNATVPQDTTDPQARTLLDRFADPDSLLCRSQCNPDVGPMEGTDRYFELELGATNCVGDARSLARLYSLLCSPRAAAGELDARQWNLAASGVDRLVGYFRNYSTGYMLPDPTRPMAGMGTRCFGFYGSGGSLAFAEVDRGLSFAFLTAQQQFHVAADPRSSTLARVAYACAADS